MSPARPRTTRGEAALSGLRGSGWPGAGAAGGGNPGGGGDISVWSQLASWLRGALFDNAALKFVALVLALTVFILVHSDEQAVAGTTLDVTYTLPADKVLVSERVDQVRITVKGTRRRIKRFHRSDLESIHIDLSHAQNGELFFQPDMIDLPEGIQLESITPASMPVRLEQRVSKQVRVAVNTSGSPVRGLKVEATEVRPPRVTVSGAASRVAQTDSVSTAEVSLDGQSKTFHQTVRLVTPPGLEIERTQTVDVEITLSEEQGSREIALPVAIQPGTGVTPEQVARYQILPSAVQVVLRGSTLAIDQVSPAQLSAYVKLEPGDASGGRTRTAEVRIQPALPGIGYEISPAEVSLQPRP